MAKIIKFWGLFIYQPQWTLTLKGWLLLIVVLLTLLTIFVTQIHSFLAVQTPIKADALLVEGWVSDSVIKGAVSEYQHGQYKIIITTGLPIERGSFLSQYQNFAELTAATLIELGIPQDKIILIPTPATKINRTGMAAKTVKKCLTNSKINIKSMNIYSFDVHTRRSWLLYQKMLPNDLKVGAIAYPSDAYDPRFWWTSSAGFRSIINEALAYIYALLFGDFS
jgi:Ni,Fe-hydrogenase III small subunit